MNEYKSENLFKHEEIYSYDDCETDNNFERIDKTLKYLYGLTEVDLKVKFDKDSIREEPKNDYSVIDLNNEDYEFFN